MPPALVVMGVAGSGKSTVAAYLAAELNWVFLEGDDFHPASNRDKMSRGIGLTDTDRHPWLLALGDEMARLALSDLGCVVACSALRQDYRARLQAATPCRFLHLHADPACIVGRLKARAGHFADARLLASQLATLEVPDPDEALALDATLPVVAIVAEIRRRLDL